MAEEKTRVDFNAPASLVERADITADLLGVSRTRLLVDALRDELDEIADDDQFRRRLRDAYYSGEIGFETVESVLGTEEMLRMKLLRESIDRDPPEPDLTTEKASGDGFYDGELREWHPDDDSEETTSSQAE